MAGTVEQAWELARRRLPELQQCVECFICGNVQSASVVLRSCGHSFCGPCLHAALARRQECPRCQQSAAVKDAVQCHAMDELGEMYKGLKLSIERRGDNDENRIENRPRDNISSSSSKAAPYPASPSRNLDGSEGLDSPPDDMRREGGPPISANLVAPLPSPLPTPSPLLLPMSIPLPLPLPLPLSLPLPLPNIAPGPQSEPEESATGADLTYSPDPRDPQHRDHEGKHERGAADDRQREEEGPAMAVCKAGGPAPVLPRYTAPHLQHLDDFYGRDDDDEEEEEEGVADEVDAEEEAEVKKGGDEGCDGLRQHSPLARLQRSPAAAEASPARAEEEERREAARGDPDNAEAAGHSPHSRPSQAHETHEAAGGDDFYGDEGINYSQFPAEHGRGYSPRDLEAPREAGIGGHAARENRDPYYGLESLEYVPDSYCDPSFFQSSRHGAALYGHGSDSGSESRRGDDEEEAGAEEEEEEEGMDEGREEEAEGGGGAAQYGESLRVVPDTEPQLGLPAYGHAEPRAAPPGRGRSSSRESDKTVLRASQTDGIDRLDGRGEARGLGLGSSSDGSLHASRDGDGSMPREEAGAGPLYRGPEGEGEGGGGGGGVVQAAPASPPLVVAAPSPAPTPSQLDNAAMEVDDPGGGEGGAGPGSHSESHYPNTLMEDTLVPTDTDDCSTGTVVPDDDDEDDAGGPKGKSAAQCPPSPLRLFTSPLRPRAGDGRADAAGGKQEASAASSSPSTGAHASKSGANHESSSDSASDCLKVVQGMRDEVFALLGALTPAAKQASLPASLPPTPDLPGRSSPQDNSAPPSVLRSAPHSAPRAASAAMVVASSCRSAGLHDLLLRCEERGWVRVNREGDGGAAGLAPVEALVMDAPPARSFKYLQALCAGVPVVSTAWLLECERQGARVDHRPHVLEPEGGDRAGLLAGLEFCLLRVRESGGGGGAGGAEAWRGLGARSGHKRQWAVGEEAEEQDEEDDDDEGLPECPLIPIPAAFGAPAGHIGQGDVIWMIVKCGGRVTHAAVGPRVALLTAEVYAQRCEQVRQRAAAARERERDRERDRLARERRERDESMRRRMFDQLTEMPLGCLDSGAPVEAPEGYDDIEEDVDDGDDDVEQGQGLEGVAGRTSRAASASAGPRRIPLLLSLERPDAPGPAKRSRAGPGRAASGGAPGMSGPNGRGSLFVAKGLQWLLEAVGEGCLPPDSDASYDIYVAEV